MAQEFNWIYKNPSPLKLKEYEKHSISPLLATIMINRNFSVSSYNNIRLHFWDIVRGYINNITNLDLAAEKILKCITDKNYKIFVFGDYDSDGITSLASVKEVWPHIRTLFAEDSSYTDIEFYVPERKEGYGLNQDWCNTIINRKKQDNNYKYLIVTFDNGVTKIKEIKSLTDAGIEVIVIDHHEPERILPNCLIVDPKKDGDRFGEELCGSGLSWLLNIKMYYNLIDKMPEHKEELKNRLSSHLMNSLINATIGTIADMVPMTVFNIALVYNGLLWLNNKNRSNKNQIDYLKDCFGLDKVTSKDIGFSLGAAINACGQMEDINIALDLFTSKANDYQHKAVKAYTLYKKSRDITKDNKKTIQDYMDLGNFDNHLFCIYIAKDIPGGICGKLANYIATTTGKPSVVLIDNGDEELLKGSGRCSNPTLSLLKLLQPLRKTGLVAKANGHSAACGVEFFRDKIDELQITLDKAIQEKIDNGEASISIINDIAIDAVLDASELNWSNFNDINTLPYSMNFSNPVFEIRGELFRVKRSSSNPNNICYTLRGKDKRKIDVWAWNIKPEIIKDISEEVVLEGYKIAMVGNFSVNFMRPTEITLDVIDLKIKKEKECDEN